MIGIILASLYSLGVGFVLGWNYRDNHNFVSDADHLSNVFVALLWPITVTASYIHYK